MTSAQKLVRQAMQLQQQGKLEQAREIYAKILETSPQHPDALHLYGLASHQLGNHQEAVTYIRHAVELVPDQPVLRNNLGDALRKAGHFEEALAQLEIALELRPDYAGAHQNLSSVYALTGEYDAALRHAREAVKLDANRPEAWFDLGLVLLDHVSLEECVEAFRKALVLRPSYRSAATSLLYCLNLLPDQNTELIAREHLTVMAGISGSVQAAPTPRNDNDRIRVGYVSGDFRAHPVSYFFEPVLESHDKARFEIFCYSDVPNPDYVTQRLQGSASHWRDISSCSDDMVIEKVNSDRIDILVDLAGHTKLNRLTVFARKPAAIQISWLGYPNSTGLDSMDFRIVDQYTSPVSGNLYGSEVALRLASGFACFRPPEHLPALQSAPLQKNGFITLGSLHKLEKLNESVIKLWAGILQENPDARLLLARDQLDDWQQRRIRSLFSQHDIAGDRLKLIRFDSSKHSFFDLFADIDIMLDSFPWSGHTLACCALWMGVPVVSLCGISHAGRMVTSVLNQLGLPELVAQDDDSYRRIVGDLCNNPAQLTRYRTELRTRFKQSPLRDEKAFTKCLEAEYHRILK